MNGEEMRQGLAVLDAYRAQLESLSQQLQLLQMSMEEATRARDTLEAFANASVGDEIMVPIGASSYVFATVGDNERAVVGIGNRLSDEKSLEDAVAYMNASLEDIKEAYSKASEAGAELEARAQQLSAALQQSYQGQQ